MIFNSINNKFIEVFVSLKNINSTFRRGWGEGSFQNMIKDEDNRERGQRCVRVSAVKLPN